MRTVVPSREVFHLWANRSQAMARNARNSVSFNDEVLNSYAEPIARQVAEGWQRSGVRSRAVLLNSRSYSVTTSGHQSHARRAVWGVPLFSVPFLFPDRDGHEGNLKHYAELIVANQAKVKRSRTHKASNAEYLQRLVTEAQDYCTFYSLNADTFDAVNLDALAEQIAEAKRQAAEAQRAADLMRAEKLAKAVPRWLAGERVELYSHPTTFLRLDADRDDVRVETSRGASVPVDDARRLFAAWEAGRVLPGMTVGHYMVRESSAARLIIGCHTLEAAEIRRFAASQGWATQEVAA